MVGWSWILTGRLTMVVGIDSVCVGMDGFFGKPTLVVPDLIRNPWARGHANYSGSRKSPHGLICSANDYRTYAPPPGGTHFHDCCRWRQPAWNDWYENGILFHRSGLEPEATQPVPLDSGLRRSDGRAERVLRAWVAILFISLRGLHKAIVILSAAEIPRSCRRQRPTPPEILRLRIRMKYLGTQDGDRSGLEPEATPVPLDSGLRQGDCTG